MSVDDRSWRVLCRRLKEWHSDQRSDREIKDIMLRGNQGSNESFDDFLDAMLIIANSLQEPMHDCEIRNRSNPFQRPNPTNGLSEELICWKCDETGHRNHDCLKPRHFFSYGCTADVYKPNCGKCKSVSKNSNQDFRKIQKVDVRRSA